MKLLTRIYGTGRERKISAQIARLLTPLMLAFVVFGVVGFTSASQSTAHASSCNTSVVRDSEAMITYFGDNIGTVKLIQNTCTGLFHGQVVCSTPGAVTLSLAAVQVPYSSYNTVNATCSTNGQIIENAPHAYVKSQEYFCATADLIINNGTDGGSGVACITQP